jgi:hypothetical protein
MPEIPPPMMATLRREKDSSNGMNGPLCLISQGLRGADRSGFLFFTVFESFFLKNLPAR